MQTATTHVGRRFHSTANGPTDTGIITEEQRLLPDGAEHPSGELFFHVTYDDGYTVWTHHSNVTLI
ncbi:hypothetical protein [Streptomyces sp. NPDC059759]|uniref:hypothetical protein n=1 Tax=Streptomyces sp. NPDC059759 TaxID=3346936 RepID=UPI00365547BE